MTTAPSQNALGIALLESGRPAEATACLEHAVSLDPGFAAAFNNLGNAYLALGRRHDAVTSYQRAVQLRPQFAEAHANLGNALRELSQPEQALVHAVKAVELQPGFSIGHNHLGAIYLALGKHEQAADCFRRAVSLLPAYFEARFNLGVTLQSLGRLAESAEQLAEAAWLRPGSAMTHSMLAAVRFGQRQFEEAAHCFQRVLQLEGGSPDVHNNLGVVYSSLRRWEEAADCFQRAIDLSPGHAEAHRNLGSVLRETGKVEQAVSALREALRLNPNYAEAWASLALALVEAGDPETALECSQRASALNPRLVAAHNHQGVALFEMGRRQEALASYDRALALEPNQADAHKNRALLWLLEGKLSEGWTEYEWRWKCAESPPPSFAQPPWDGSPLEGRTILLYAEQGLGDTLQFVRYAQLVCERGGRVILSCQRALVPLLERCRHIERLVAQGDPLPPFDVHAPLVSLPRIFGTTLDNVPATAPYLDADPRLVERWREEVRALAGFKIGIAWQGSRNYRRDRARSVPLAAFVALAAVPGVRLISLQKGDGSEQLGDVAGRCAVLDLASRLDESSGAFMDTAAVMKNLDLVITSDTSIPHLAGALGVPVWVALPHICDWRWLLDRDDSPWYPTMRLFRQAVRGDWQEVFERIAAALATRLAKHQSVLIQNESKKDNERLAL